jgi:acyl-CoA thioesterase
MAIGFEISSQIKELDRDRYLAHTNSSWQQGRGVFGGLLLALVARSAQASCPDRRLRSLSMEFVAPAVPGEIELRVQAERSGLLVARQSIRLLQDDKLVGLATTSLARDRNTRGDFQSAQIPACPPAESVDPVPFAPPMPAFTQHLRYRFCLGAAPGSGSEQSRTGGWIEAPDVRQPGDTALIAALLDSWFPAWLCRMNALAPMATVSFHAHFLSPWGPDPGSTPVLIENISDAAVGGYATETNQLWSRDGRLLARSQQLLALLGG